MSVELLFFYTTWCHQCVDAMPEWTELVNEYNDKTINGVVIRFTEVDCSEYPMTPSAIADKYEIEMFGFPTILLQGFKLFLVFSGKITKDRLLEFIHETLNDTTLIDNILNDTTLIANILNLHSPPLDDEPRQSPIDKSIELNK